MSSKPICAPNPSFNRAREVRVSQDRSYEVQISGAKISDCLDTIVQWLDDKPALVVMTPTVASLYGMDLVARLEKHGAPVSAQILPCTESSKTLAAVELVCARAAELKLERRSLLIGLGGGVCTDIVTVAASLIRRGIRHIRIPTTLIGQVDAGIGIKGAVNFNGRKSYLGCFYPPHRVLILPHLLSTLSTDHLQDGIAEIIKIALVRDAVLLAQLEALPSHMLSYELRTNSSKAAELIWRSATGMLDELEPNLYEDKQSKRAVDFGHTFSPLIEAASGYSISHGSAVAMDMALTSILAEYCGLLSVAKRDRILTLLTTNRLPVWAPELDVNLCREALHAATLHRCGELNLVLPVNDGGVHYISSAGDITDPMFAHAVAYLKTLGRASTRLKPIGTEL
jgi:2-epi-5-epi-valiolone synthase